jgi:hypothetical protein
MGVDEQLAKAREFQEENKRQYEQAQQTADRANKLAEEHPDDPRYQQAATAATTNANLAIVVMRLARLEIAFMEAMRQSLPDEDD